MVYGHAAAFAYASIVFRLERPLVRCDGIVALCIYVCFSVGFSFREIEIT